MLNLPLDPGYCYDFLAIQQVKTQQGLQSKQTFDFYDEVLRVQAGTDLHNAILGSAEYLTCVRVNTITYDGVEDARYDRVPASVVWNRNNDRFIAKNALQKRFFPNIEVTEKKS